ncbi:MAG: transglycosylase SLT domain-containing protein [Candidatus Eisenbacteria bacterium]|nr:transglycosylase SLT domain-containing protein [Candidatus Eisenbacteria bacterium]
MTRHLWIAVFLAVAVSLATAQPAQATWRSRADSLRQAADNRFDSGDYARSAELYAAAISTLETGAGPSPNLYFAAKKGRARYLMARSYELLERWEKAVSGYRTCLEELPEISDFVRLRIAACEAGRGDYEAAIKELRVLTDDDIDTVYDAASVLSIAGYYEKSGNLDMALQWYRVYLSKAETYNDRALAHFRIGRAYERRGDQEAAIRSYDTAVREFPRSSYAHDAMTRARSLSRAFTDRYSQGLVLYNRGLYSDAVEFFTWYLRHEDNPTRAHEARYFLGRAHQRLGNFQTAASSYEDAICAGPDSEYFNLAWSKLAYCLRAGGHAEQSLATYDRFVELYPGREGGADLLWEKGRYLEEKRRWDEALATYSNLVERWPRAARAADVRFRSGLCLYKQGRHAEAGALFAEIGLGAADEEASRALFWAAKCIEAQRGIRHAVERYVEAAAAAPGSYYGVRAGARLREAGLQESGILFPGRAPGSRVSIYHLAGARDDGRASTNQGAAVWGGEALEFASWLAEWYDRVYLPVSRVALRSQIFARPEFIRVDTFLALHLRDEALTELEVLEDEVGDDPRALDLMVDYCERSGLHRRAIRLAERILTMSPAGGLSGAPTYLLKRICPTHFSGIIEAECAQRGIDPHVEYSLIRQESLFEPTAVSWVGARGLSQIMPATGSWIANRLRYRGYNRSKLFDPATNIRFGTEYLAVQIAEFDGDVLRALAAYNGGPESAARWWEFGGGLDSDVFVEDIGYEQTNDYVRRVFLYSEVYRALYAP